MSVWRTGLFLSAKNQNSVSIATTTHKPWPIVVSSKSAHAAIDLTFWPEESSLSYEIRIRTKIVLTNQSGWCLNGVFVLFVGSNKIYRVKFLSKRKNGLNTLICT